MYRQPRPRARRLSNGAVRFLSALDRILGDNYGWDYRPAQKVIDRGLLWLMAALVSAMVLSQLAIHYHVSVSFFGA